MKNINKTFYLLFLIFSLIACNNDDYVWENNDFASIIGPSIWTINTDSMIFTFTIFESSFTEFVVDAEVVLMGKTKDYNRDVNIIVDDELTSASSSHYSFPSTVTIEANEKSAYFPITLNRTKDLEEKTVKLTLKVSETGDLGPGVNEWNTFTIIFSDMIARPTNWNLLSEFFGEYSNVKYRFIISTLGINQFTYGESNGMSWGEMYFYRLTLVEELNKYNAANPNNPLTDENNVLVTF